MILCSVVKCTMPAKKFAKNSGKPYENATISEDDASNLRLNQALKNDAIDANYGFNRTNDSAERTGFLLNIQANEVLDNEKRLVSVLDLYFVQDDGYKYKTSHAFKPYFYILVKRETEQEVAQFLLKKYVGLIASVEVIPKDDLDLANHLIGIKQKYLKISFYNTTDLGKVRKDILPAVKKNSEKEKGNTFYTEMISKALVTMDAHLPSKANTNHFESILDIREHDVPYHVRVSIDMKIFCGRWYTVQSKGLNIIKLLRRDDIMQPPEPIVLAFDIETTKLPLKFPDSSFDQIMMISYMIDGRGYLINNREIIACDVDDFEYTPKPEFEGYFTVYNQANELQLLLKFFDCINDVKPYVIVTYNGDFFDWPFVEARAKYHGLDMESRIGFFKDKSGCYVCRASVHMDCLCWVKRDSYLPVGSQNLKAVAKNKLRYDPIEIDPEDMCRFAAEKPQVLCNYSVSDAVATYYLYMKYVHPFIFALCTIIPSNPDEVLRKGSGTLCEYLLMVEAYHVNIVYPNKQESVLNKLTDDGHVLHQETYVGGHVEALESGVFRADLPCRFKLVPEMFEKIINEIPKTLQHAIEVEEKVPMSDILNLNEVISDIKEKLVSLKDNPNRTEKPTIFHLDVGAMYPNVILTNRLQPSAVVNDTICASCDFNKYNALCKRNMNWSWRGEFMPATKNEYLHIKQQLETERFPPVITGKPHRAFYQLSKEEQAEYEKKRLTDYCKRAYKKTKVTRLENRTTTVCQRENPFYVDCVRAFRDRRYEYKRLAKVTKQRVQDAIASGDVIEIRAAKNLEIVYDSLQLAHKCILNSFYGYVMRRGARWYSMEMAGIVCHTGANIIRKAREIVEKIGRPLELDTDGIWCMLPSSFPNSIDLKTTNEKKKKLTISYPNAILNSMVKDDFTNQQYHVLKDQDSLEYEVRSENSIFFEVDGPYLCMVLPASKEEGKKIKKRYAVFNFDGSLAELKGFEVKRRGELQLIKNFQSSVFEAFLKGDDLEDCYANVAKVADYWLDVLFTRGSSMPDSELFDLISEKKSMSRKLEEYGAQKSTSISTAKRLAEFLGEKMVQDAGLACKYIISRKPEDAPVTERAIPLAIFQTDESIKKHFLRKWLKDPALDDFDIREILDWNYYIERLGGTIQKIISIPAAMQGISNPVPRIKHPDWLHKKMLEKNDAFKQRRIDEIFSAKKKPDVMDIEDFNKDPSSTIDNEVEVIGTVARVKRKRPVIEEVDITRQNWKDVLGPPPPFSQVKTEYLKWLNYHKKKWEWQSKQKLEIQKLKRMNKSVLPIGPIRTNTGTIGGFLRRNQANLLNIPWQIIQIVETKIAGEFKLWICLYDEIRQIKLTVPRIFYANLKKPKSKDEDEYWKKVSKILPRSRPVYHLYKFTIPESLFAESGNQLLMELSDSNIEGIYETQIPLMFRILIELGCVCKVNRSSLLSVKESDKFALDQLEFLTVQRQPYLDKNVINFNHIYLYHHSSSTSKRQFFGLFLTPIDEAVIIVIDTVKTNLMPNMNNLYASERESGLRDEKKSKFIKKLPTTLNWDLHFETDMKKVNALLDKALKKYKDANKGATLIAVQSKLTLSQLRYSISMLNDYPQAEIHISDPESMINNLEWQKQCAKSMIAHYLYSDRLLEITLEQCRYLHIPIGNMPADAAIFGCDLLYCRQLVNHNFVLWYSKNDNPDLGGSQESDARLFMDFLDGSCEITNNPGCYKSVCVELDIDSLAINTLLQSHHINEVEGTSSAIAFDAVHQISVQDNSQRFNIQLADDTIRCAEAFKVLRSIASSWMRDVTISKNEYADFLIVHFYRWIRSTTSLMYEPAILKTLQNLMKKLFIQLVAEFRKLGSIIVFANYSKIIVNTKKHELMDAIEYLEFIVKSIRTNELFHGIEVNYYQFWEYLLWMDIANFGGIKKKRPRGLNAVGEADLSEVNSYLDEYFNDDDRVLSMKKPKIVMNWNISDYLPVEAGCQTSFNLIIAGYISATYMQFKELESISSMHNQKVVNNQTEEIDSQKYHEFVNELLSEKTSQKLFEITERIFYSLPECPVPALSQNILGEKMNPALEFAKAICQVLKLDATVEEAIYSLKRNLLRLIGVGEFHSQAEWTDPNVSYILPEIICQSCNHCRDIDLGRDNHKHLDIEVPAWYCPVCQTNYNMDDIEEKLIKIINHNTIAYNLQDLKCNKCHQIKMDNLMKNCECSGDYSCLISQNDFKSNLNIFHRIASTFQLPMLLEHITWLLDLK